MMNTMTFKTPWVRSSGWAKGLALLALAAAGWAATSSRTRASQPSRLCGLGMRSLSRLRASRAMCSSKRKQRRP